MRMPRVFLESARAGAIARADEVAFRHLVTVLRRSVGDPVVVLDGAGGAFDATIESIDAGRRTLRLRVGDPVEAQAVAAAPLTVAVAVPRGDGLETSIRIGSEIGLARLEPLITARTVARPRAGSGKVERWRRLAVESAAQCQRAAPIEIADPLEWRAFLERFPERAAGGAHGWIAIPGGPPPNRCGLLDRVRAGDEEVVVAIGPEGGFEPAEIEDALETGLDPVGFPTPILKTPTAVLLVAALSVLGRE